MVKDSIRVKTNNAGSTGKSDSHLGDENDGQTASQQPTQVPLEASLSPQGRKTKLSRRANSQRSLESNSSLGGRNSRSCEEGGSRPGSFDTHDDQGVRKKNNSSSNRAKTLSTGAAAAAHSTISALYKESSFDVDVDEDDENYDGHISVDIHRYHVDFSATENGHVLTNHNMHGSFSSINGRASNRCSPSSICRCLWYTFQAARQKARERRADLLLRHTEPNCRQSSWIFLVTLCDATDRGILVVAGIMIAWIVLIVVVKNPVPRLRIIIAGTVFLVIRLGTRPLVNYCINQRTKRLQSAMQPLPQNSPPFRLSPSSSVPGEENSSKGSSKYLNRKMNGQNTAMEMAAVQSNWSALGLYISNSNESDPTIAAI